jgi:hypothetical protein
MLRNNLLTLLWVCMLPFAANADAIADRLLDVSPRGELIFERQGAAMLAHVVLPDAALAVNYIAQYKNQQLQYEVVDTDRYGRPHMIVYADANSTSLQQHALQQGLAMVYSAQPFAQAPAWLMDEALARKNKRGFWNNPDSLLVPENAAANLHKFAIVQGNFTTIYRARDAYYINFGERWRQDFSIKIPRKSWRIMEAWITQFEQQLSLTADTESKRMIADANRPMMLRVRGAVTQENGPMMVVTHPQQLEIVSKSE